MTATASAPATIQIKNKALYRGTIKDQQVILMGKKDVQYPALMLTIGLEGEVIDAFKPDRGVQPCPRIDVDAFLKFDDANGQGMEIAMNDLERLGFEGDDIEELNPANGKKHQSFVGRIVHISPNVTMRNDKESIFWNLRFPRSLENSKLGKGELSKTSGGQAFRELMTQRRAQGGNPTF